MPSEAKVPPSTIDIPDDGGERSEKCKEEGWGHPPGGTDTPCVQALQMASRISPPIPRWASAIFLVSTLM